MNLTTFKSEAAAKIGPLAAHVRTLVAQLAHLRHRLETERGNVEKRVTDLESLKAAAASYLEGDTFPTFKVRLKRATENLTAARESVVLFETDLLPRTETGLAEARQRLTREFTALYVAARPACETKMAEALALAVAAHDDFLAAFAELGRTFGCSFRGDPPVVFNARLGTVKARVSGGRWLELLPGPAAPPATRPGAAIPVAPARTKTPPTAEHDPGVEEQAPTPPEAAVLPPGAAVASRVRVLRRCAVAETPLGPAENPPEAALDAPDPDTLDAPPPIEGVLP